MRLTTLILCAGLTGCTYLDPAIQRVADAHDQALVAGELAICRAGSVRAVIERYARDPETWRAYLHLCGYVRQGVSRPILDD